LDSLAQGDELLAQMTLDVGHGALQNSELGFDLCHLITLCFQCAMEGIIHCFDLLTKNGLQTVDLVNYIRHFRFELVQSILCVSADGSEFILIN
jgi:hypothetical protein